MARVERHATGIYQVERRADVDIGTLAEASRLPNIEDVLHECEEAAGSVLEANAKEWLAWLARVQASVDCRALLSGDDLTRLRHCRVFAESHRDDDSIMLLNDRMEISRRLTRLSVSLKRDVGEHIPAAGDDRGWMDLQAAVERCQRDRVKLTGRKRPKRKRDDGSRRPLTAKQAEAVEVVCTCNGNIAKAAKQLGRDRKTVYEHYITAMDKLGKDPSKRHKVSSLPHDRRGQPMVVEEPEEPD